MTSHKTLDSSKITTHPREAFAVGLAVFISLLLAGCGHKQAKVSVPPPPPIETPHTQDTQNPEAGSQRAEPEDKKASRDKNLSSEKEDEEAEEAKEASAVPPNAKPILEETGLASWYGPPYHNRRGSNGEVYNMNAFTAAHRTLPLGSIVRVTNVKTGSSAIVRITDRGPFIEGRILDLSLAAAKKIDLWRAGVMKVHLEVLKTPVPLTAGGRWAVQIGGFDQHDPANEVADHLTRRYHTAKVLCFNSPAGDWWVRVRVKDDDRKRAEEIARETRTTQGSIFLVRLD
jgi:peptidoglycan lytic transglycosylase